MLFMNDKHLLNNFKYSLNSDISVLKNVNSSKLISFIASTISTAIANTNNKTTSSISHHTSRLNVPSIFLINHHNTALSNYSIIDNTSEITNKNFYIIDDLNEIKNIKLTSGIVILAIILSLIVILTIFGNIFVLLAIFIDFHLRSPTHYLMGSLALADLLLGTTVLPFSTVEQLLNYWPFGNIFCEIWLATDVLCCTASIYLVLAISVDRYIGVTRPLRYNLIMTKKRVYIIILFVWILSLIVSLAPFLGWKKPKTTNKTCEVNDNVGYALFSTCLSFYIPLLIILLVYYRIYKEASRQSKFLKTGRKTSKIDHNDRGITLRVHIGPSTDNKKKAYFNTFYTKHRTSLQQQQQQRADNGNHDSFNGVRNSINGNGNYNLNTPTTPTDNTSSSKITNGRKKSSSIFFPSNSTGLPFTLSGKLAKFKREQKAAKTLAIVVGCFILCWMPFFIILPIQSFCRQCNVPELLFKIFFWLGYCNSMMNPFIYAFSSREFRKAYKGILHCNLYYGNNLTSTKLIYNSHSTNIIQDYNSNHSNHNTTSANNSINANHSHVNTEIGDNMRRMSSLSGKAAAIPAKLSLPYILETSAGSDNRKLLPSKTNNSTENTNGDFIS